MFIVSGGGGGPRVKLLEGSAQRHQDLFKGPSPRPFHYLKIVHGVGILQFSVFVLEKGGTQIQKIDDFSVAVSSP